MRDDGGADAQDQSQSTAAQGPEDQRCRRRPRPSPAGGHGQASESCLVREPDHRAHRHEILDSLAAVFPTPMLAVGVGHFSRRTMGTTVFRMQPSNKQVCDFLTKTIRDTKAKPNYIVCDKGTHYRTQFWCIR